MSDKKPTYYELNKAAILAKKKAYNKANRAKVLEQKKTFRDNNKAAIKEYKQTYYELNKDTVKTKVKEYNNSNPDYQTNYQRDYFKKRYNSDPLFRLKSNITNMIRKGFKKVGSKKVSRTEQILGCSYIEFKAHLEAQFEDWMDWSNYGLYNGFEGYGWDIDHITPKCTAITESDIVRLNHYTNLKPLDSYINRYVKKDNI